MPEQYKDVITAVWASGVKYQQLENKMDNWIKVSEGGYPKHNGSFLCKVEIEEECMAISHKMIVLDYIFTPDIKMYAEMKMKNGTVNEYGCNYFNHNSDLPLTVTHWMPLPESPKL